MKKLRTISVCIYYTVFITAARAEGTPPDTSFYLSYAVVGLGSNLETFQPAITIKGTNFVYTYEQNSYLWVKSGRIDTICVKTFRQSSIDSILAIVKDLRDTTISRFNHCVISGCLYCMRISNGDDTVHFDMMNTFDYTALKIAVILNQYAPSQEQLPSNDKMIKDAEDCLERKRKQWAEEDKGKGKL